MKECKHTEKGICKCKCHDENQHVIHFIDCCHQCEACGKNIFMEDKFKDHDIIFLMSKK